MVRTPLKDRHFAVLGSTDMADQSTVQHVKQAIIVQRQKVRYQFLKGVSYYCLYTTEGQTLCSAGQYRDGRSINCTTCEAGYYCPNTKGKVPVFKRCELLLSIHH